jgi:secreted protein with Ig-like and vWFA domain
MNIPLLGPMTLTGFTHAWFFIFLIVPFALAAMYIAAQFARRRRVLRFANMELLESVAPQRPSCSSFRWFCSRSRSQVPPTTSGSHVTAPW